MTLTNISLLVSSNRISPPEFIYGQPWLVAQVPMSSGDQFYPNIAFEYGHDFDNLGRVDMILKSNKWEFLKDYSYSFRIYEYYDKMSGQCSNLFADITNISMDEALLLKLSI